MVRSSRRKWRRAPVVKSESFLIVGQASFLVCLGSKNHPRGARTPECKVGQTIAFRGLSSLTKGRLVDRRQKTNRLSHLEPAADTSVCATSASLRALSSS